MKAAALATLGVAAVVLLPWAIAHFFGPFVLTAVSALAALGCLWALFYLLASNYEVR